MLIWEFGGAAKYATAREGKIPRAGHVYLLSYDLYVTNVYL